jgi:hypothetical protein
MMMILPLAEYWSDQIKKFKWAGNVACMGKERE